MKVKKEKIDYLLFLLAFFITAMANAITINNFTLIIAMLISLFFFIKRGYKLDKLFIYFTFIYLLMLTIYLLKFGYLDPRTVREYIKIFYAYILIKMLWDKLIPYFVKTVYILAIISFPFYILQLIDYNIAKSIVGVFEHNIPFLDMRGNWYENIFVFTLNDNGIYRNSGFAWEPKGFGTFLVLAMFFRLIQNKFNLFDKKIIIYIIAAITTLSTATITIIFFAVLPFYLYNKNISSKLIASIILIPIVIFTFLNVGFLKDKILKEYETRDKFVGYIEDTKYKGVSRSLGRFGSLLVDFQDFKKEPIIGYGNQKFERTMFSVGGVKLVRVNGLSDYMAKYGIVGILFLIITLSITFKFYAKLYRFKGSFWIVLGILMISFSSAVLFTPLYLMFQFFPFIKNSIKINKLNSKALNKCKSTT